MIILKILRFILPPFHPLKYKWIKYWYGKQSDAGAWKDIAQPPKLTGKK